MFSEICSFLVFKEVNFRERVLIRAEQESEDGNFVKLGIDKPALIVKEGLYN